MGLETATYLDDLVSTNPVGATDPKAQGDDHLRLIKSVLRATFPGLAGSAFRLQTKSSNYMLAVTDNMSVLVCTAALTLTLPDAGAIGNKQMTVVICKGPSVLIDPTGTDTVNGSSSMTLSFNEAVLLFCDGASDFPIMKLGGIGGSASTGDVKASVRATVEPGWLLAFGTIGSAASGATNRANADCEALFKLLWTDWANAQAPVSGGRGISAAADWTANKTIGVPDMRGLGIAGKSNMGGVDAGNLSGGSTLGAALGAQTHIHSVNINTTGNLTVNVSGVTDGAGQAEFRSAAGPQEQQVTLNHTHAINFNSGTTGNLNVSGSTAAGSSVQPTRILNIFIKL